MLLMTNIENKYCRSINHANSNESIALQNNFLEFLIHIFLWFDGNKIEKDSWCCSPLNKSRGKVFTRLRCHRNNIFLFSNIFISLFDKLCQKEN